MKFLRNLFLTTTISLLAFGNIHARSKVVLITNYSAEPIDVFHVSNRGKDSKDYGWTVVEKYEQKIKIPKGNVKQGEKSTDVIKNRKKELKFVFEPGNEDKIVVINEQKRRRDEYAIPSAGTRTDLTYFSEKKGTTREAGLQETRRR